MPINNDELEGSPSIVMDRTGGSAKRIFKIAWEDIGLAILEVFPGALFGYPYTASLPGFPWLRATRMSIDAFDPNRPTGTNQVINTYPAGAKIVVDYEPLKFPDAVDNDTPAEDDKPKDPSGQDITFLEHRVTFGGEYLTWPNNGVRWDKAADGTGYSPGTDKKHQVFEDINVGIVIPTIEHELTWNYVAGASVPWRGIRNCLGKVNTDQYIKVPPECLLFSGATAERSYSTVGIPAWKLTYRFSEKCYNYPVPAGQVAQGWNHFLRPGTGKFEKLVRRDGTGVYQSARFRQLYGGLP